MLEINGKQPMVYMLVDTSNKSVEQLTDEVVDKVNCAVDNELNNYRDKLSATEFDMIARILEAKKNDIIRQFIFQINNMKEINKRLVEV